MENTTYSTQPTITCTVEGVYPDSQIKEALQEIENFTIQRLQEIPEVISVTYLDDLVYEQ